MSFKIPKFSVAGSDGTELTIQDLQRAEIKRMIDEIADNSKGKADRRATIVAGDDGLELNPETSMPGFKRLTYDCQALVKSLCKPRRHRSDAEMVKLKSFIKAADFWR